MAWDPESHSERIRDRLAAAVNRRPSRGIWLVAISVAFLVGCELVPPKPEAVFGLYRERMLSGDFTLEDFSQQISQVLNMGPIGKIMGMLPGELGKMSQSIDPAEAEKRVKTSQAIIHSMTPAERRNPKILNASRRKRIASGSGTQVYEVNQLIKQYRDARNMFKQLKKSGLGKLPRLS